MMKNGILIAAVVILMCACVAIGLIGYYSVGFTDWTKFGGEAPPAETETPDELEVPEEPVEIEPVKYYSNIEVGDILGTVYFNKDFDIKSFLAESIGENQSDYNYLRIEGGSATGNNWQIIVAYLFDESLADDGVVMIGCEGFDTIEDGLIYISDDFCVDEGQDIWMEAGWHIEGDSINLTEAGVSRLEVTEVVGQNLFKYFISGDGVFAEI